MTSRWKGALVSLLQGYPSRDQSGETKHRSLFPQDVLTRMCWQSLLFQNHRVSTAPDIIFMILMPRSITDFLKRIASFSAAILVVMYLITTMQSEHSSQIFPGAIQRQH